MFIYLFEWGWEYCAIIFFLRLITLGGPARSSFLHSPKNDPDRTQPLRAGTIVLSTLKLKERIVNFLSKHYQIVKGWYIY